MTATLTSAPKTSTGWGWVLAAGIGITIVGLFMLVYPGWASLAVTLFIGWSLIAAGAFSIVGGIMNRAEGGMWTSIILGVLALIAGVFLAFNLLAGTLTLTMVFVIWLIADGIVGIVSSIVRRTPGWGWWLTSSIITLALGIMLFNAMPLASIAVLGIYAGIVLLFRGMVMTFLAFELRHLGKAA